jgi:RHS repeat-associated protein
MLQPNRHGGESYTYNFQGQETDDEVKGKGNSVNYKYRMHDPRLGRFFAVDPLAPKYPHNGPYNFSENRVIDGVELEGLEVALLNPDATVETGPLSNEYADQKTSEGSVDISDKTVISPVGDVVYHNPHSGGSVQGVYVAEPSEFLGGGTILKDVGTLGSNIDMERTGLYYNRLEKSTNLALTEGFSTLDWINTVRGAREWDLKGNINTIWGLAWSYHLTDNSTQTSFSSKNYLFNTAADFGNYHAGFTGSMVGVPTSLQEIGAGGYEQLKNLTSFELLNFITRSAESNWLASPFNWNEPQTFMDNSVDHFWNSTGMADALFLKTKLGLSSSQPMLIVPKIKK